MMLPRWRDAAFENLVSPVILLAFAAICCFAGAYYAFHVDESEHRHCGLWTVGLLLAGIMFIYWATAPWWAGVLK